jgi:predicted GNAT family N-acyltransferase
MLANQQREDFDKATALRLQIFTKEQSFDPTLELDEFDKPWIRPDVLHILAVDEYDMALGTVRMKHIDGKAHLGRLAVSKQARGTGLGRKLCEYGAAQAISRWDVDTVLISSQHQVRKFYEGLGYVYNEAKGYYLDEDWSHCEMSQRFSKEALARKRDKLC